jgi:hypothetical protein
MLSVTSDGVVMYFVYVVTQVLVTHYIHCVFLAKFEELIVCSAVRIVCKWRWDFSSVLLGKHTNMTDLSS